MRATHIAGMLVATLLLQGQAVAAGQFKSEQEAQQHCPADTVVWLNTSSGRVHEKGMRWYGHTQAGAYVCRQELAGQAGRAERTDKAGPWMPLGRIDAFGGGATLYFDPASVRRAGGNVDMLTLLDFRNAQQVSGLKFLSSKFRKEFDCKKGNWRILNSSIHAESMGAGREVQSDTEAGDWQHAEPDSLAKTEWDAACKKRDD